MDTQAGAQFATNSQTTIDLQAGIIASHQDEIGRANVRITDQAAEIERLKIVVADRNAKVAELMGVAARAEIAADEITLLKRQIQNLKRHIAEYCPAAPAAPSEQARPTVKQLAAQLDDDKPWTRAEQDAFAVFLARFPNESSQGIMSLGDSWKAGRAFEDAAAPAAPLPAQHKPEMPAILFDGYTVYKALTKHEESFTTYQNVSAVLDALARIWRDIDGAAPLPELTGPSEADDEKLQRNIMLGMADCMDMVRTDLIEMGIIDKTVAPMFIPEAVANYCQRLAAPPSPAPAPTEPQQTLPSDLTTMDCPDCGGSGEALGSFACEECHGQGKIIVSASDPSEAQNAARYRWLRDQWDGTCNWQDMEVLRDGGADMDAAIDAAIAKVSTSPVSRMGGITSKESAETAAPGASTEDKQ